MASALCSAGYQVEPLVLESEDGAVNQKFISAAAVDAVFIALHGRYGEDGGIQQVLTEMDLPYTGSDAAASRLAMDKVGTQGCLQEAGLPVPAYDIVNRTGPEKAVEIFRRLGGRVVVKPPAEGSSIGVHSVSNTADLSRAVTDALQYGSRVLIEKFIAGRELTVGILDDRALPVIEICPRGGFFDFRSKYQKGCTEYHVPADLPEETAGRARDAALTAFQVLGCRDMARVDMMLDQQDNLYLLEVNTIPGFTETSLLPMAAAEAGIGFPRLCSDLIASALQRQKSERGD